MHIARQQRRRSHGINGRRARLPAFAGVLAATSVDQRDGTPWCFQVRTRAEAIAAVAKLQVGSLAENVAGSPHASPADLADQGRSYATKFLATLGDPNVC